MTLIRKGVALNAAHIESLLIGQHPLIERIHALIGKIATTDATVLVTGESGTGKELIARAIHDASRRESQSFLPVNCAALPGDLLESELFGHERGSFTGAIRTRPGLFALAHGGTLFLDEVGETSPRLQVKLLRVLQEREIRPVGSDVSVPIDVRVIAATNKDLGAEVREGRFREDLYYRLHVIPIEVPPLRERRSDIPILIEHFLGRLAGTHGVTKKRMSESAMVRLWEYDWPGNVRELENLLERLVILSDSDEIELDDLPPTLRAFSGLRPAAREPKFDDHGLDFNRAVEAFEDRLIGEALRRTRGNKQAAARLLGLKRTTLVAKLRRRQPTPGAESLVI